MRVATTKMPPNGDQQHAEEEAAVPVSLPIVPGVEGAQQRQPKRR